MRYIVSVVAGVFVSSAAFAQSYSGTFTTKNEQGGTVTLTATPSSGSRFRNWSGACSGSSPTCVLSMTADRTVNARFRRG